MSRSLLASNRDTEPRPLVYSGQLATEVSVVRGKRVSIGVLSLVVLLVASFVALPATSTRFKLGEDVAFHVNDSTTWFWGCCTCEATLVLGWRIVSSMEQVIYSVVHDAPVASSTWIGTWGQIDSTGAAVPAGQYKLYVDTSVGTLSRCFTLYDPCGCGWCHPCTACACEDVSSITTCACRASLVFNACQTGCFSFPLFWGWSSCGCTNCP
jgi:hypothetical protein